MPNSKHSPALPAPTLSTCFIGVARLLRNPVGALSLLALAGCKLELFAPQGDIGVQEKTLILLALGVMLLVVIPVILLTFYFAWRYREGNTKAVYAPTWAHSSKIEIIVWGIPCIIVICLAILIWKSTHTLDPYQPIRSPAPPLQVEVVALNWKWLFIYPQYSVASVNQLAIPVDRPVAFKLTSASIMNAFFIPQLGSMVYAMGGMQTQLNLIANAPGIYHGLSAAYSGAGFSDMQFDTLAGNQEQFDAWIARAKKSPQILDQASYQELQKDSIKDPVRLYAKVDAGLFLGIVNQYMKDAHQQVAMQMPVAAPVPVPQRPRLSAQITE